MGVTAARLCEPHMKPALRQSEAVVSMQLDNSILETRILHQETDFPGFHSIGRCADKLQNLKNSTNDDTSAVDAFTKEIAYFRLEMGKLNRSFKTCDSESANYRAIADGAAAEIAKARLDIMKLQSDLIVQQEVRVHREKLEIIAKVVNLKENKSSLKRKIANMEESIKNLDDSIEAADSHLQIRAKQFDSLMESIAVLQGDLVEEDTEKTIEEGSADADESQDADMNGYSGRADEI